MGVSYILYERHPPYFLPLLTPSAFYRSRAWVPKRSFLLHDLNPKPVRTEWRLTRLNTYRLCPLIDSSCHRPRSPGLRYRTWQVTSLTRLPNQALALGTIFQRYDIRICCRQWVRYLPLLSAYPSCMLTRSWFTVSAARRCKSDTLGITTCRRNRKPAQTNATTSGLCWIATSPICAYLSSWKTTFSTKKIFSPLSLIRNHRLLLISVLYLSISVINPSIKSLCPWVSASFLVNPTLVSGTPRIASSHGLKLQAPAC